jgi:hypothetical protein
MLLVHDTFVLTKLKCKHACVKEAKIVDPLGPESVSMKELMLPSKGKALELKAIEEVERDEHQELVTSQALNVQRKDLKTVDAISSERHETQVCKETLKPLDVGLLHETNQDTVIEKTISLLALRVFDVGPIFIVVVDILQAISISLFVEKLTQIVGVSL